jgi:chromosome segregation ATPase
MLNDMSDTLQSDQDDADSKHSDFQEKCSSDADYYNSEISESTDRINTANSDLGSLTPELESVQQSLSDANANLQSLQEQLETAVSQRQSEADEYTKKVDEHENALTAIHDALAIFQELSSESSSSFLQKKSNVFAQVQSNIKKAIPSMRSGYQGIFKLLAQIVEKAPEEANQDILTKILDLLKKIRDNIENSSQAEKVAENQRISAYEELSSTLQANINNAQSDIVTFSNKIDTLNIAIGADDEEVEQQTQRLEQRKQQLTDRTGECTDEDDSYEVDLAKRFFSIKIV